MRLDYSAEQRRITVGYYKYNVEQFPLQMELVFEHAAGETYTGLLQFTIVRSNDCQRVVIDFGSEASQIGYKNCGPQSAIVQYDILENIISQLKLSNPEKNWKREDFLNHENGQQMLYRSFYAINRHLDSERRRTFPFNFTNDLLKDEIRLFITRQEVAATEFAFRDDYSIIPNLKLGIEKSIQLSVGQQTEDYSIRTHKKELISAILLRLLRLMISTKPAFRQGGLIVTLLVPNIYTQHDVFDLLNELRNQKSKLLESLDIPANYLFIEYETISESDAAFMGYQQTHPEQVKLSNGEMALVIDCGKGTTDISMVLADDNENYSSFFRTGFAGAGNVLLYAFAEDFLTTVLRAIPGNNDLSVKEFIRREILDQNLTADALNFIQLMEEYKKKFDQHQAISLSEFSNIAENSLSTERTIGNLHKDQSTLLQYAVSILNDRSIRWDEEITGIIEKANDCIVHCIIASVKDVMTRDIRRRIKSVMLSGRAFYFTGLRRKLEKELKDLLGNTVTIHSVPPGRSLNNKNVAIHGAFTGAYKITDFTGIPIDKKEGLSKNNDVLNNNLYLYRGIKIEPGNDILYNGSVVRRNHHELRPFKNKTMDIYFTRDNIYLRQMESQQVKDVRSLYSILSSVPDNNSPLQDLKAISMFPGQAGELASITALYSDVVKERTTPQKKKRRRQGIFSFLHLPFMFLLLFFSTALLAQQPAGKPIRIADSLTAAEKAARNPILLRTELDSLVKVYAPVPVDTEAKQPVEVAKQETSLVPVLVSGIIILMLAYLIYLIRNLRSNEPKTKEDKNQAQSLESRIIDLKTELLKVSKENEGLNRVVKEYNGIQHEYDSLKHGMFKAYKIKNYPGYDKSKAEAAAMQSVLGIENAVAVYSYEKFLKPILAIADANKNSPAKTTEADREKILDLLVSLSLLYIEYLYLRVNDLSIGGKMVERILAVSKGNGPDISVLRKLDTEFGSRALVIRMALNKASLEKLCYPVFDETNLNNQ